MSQGIHLNFESEPCDNCSRKELKFKPHEELIIDDLLRKFLDKNIIEPTEHLEGEVLSNIFIRPKPDGSYRLILNLSKLNEHLEYKHFKMETLKSALESIKQNCFCVKLDIQDAYYRKQGHVKVHILIY